jgi:hypothetical protein
MSKLVTFLLGLCLASIVYADPGDGVPIGSDQTSDDLTRGGFICPDGTVVDYEAECLYGRQDPPILTPPTKPHIGWEEPR